VDLQDDGDFAKDLRSAKERDLRPLLQDSIDALELDSCKADRMESFLTEAWVHGTNASHAQILARTLQREATTGRAGIEKVETEFKALMEESADALNLTVDQTIVMWSYLGQAWIAGTHSCETEVMASLLETKSDVAEEALRWLEDESPG
jgi:hypothetical protein